MGFWLDFGEIMQTIWNMICTPMTIGGYTFSLGDVLVWSGVFSVVGFIVWGIVDREI